MPNTIGLALCLFVFGALVLGCGSSAPKKPIPATYLGTWTGQDGTTLTIRNNNTGDYKSGGTKVDGAAVEVDEAAKTINFTMVGMDVGKYTIDSPPAGGQMKLSGQTFKGGSGGTGGSTTSTTTSTTTTSSNSANANAASDEE
jgi:hypothetical protein